MPTPAAKSKFETHGTYGHSPKFTPLRDDLLSSAAFLSLKPTDQAVLIDYIKHYNASTSFDRDESKLTKPVMYTFGMCAVLISKNTFYRSMVALQTHGFINDYHGNAYQRGKAARWTATTRWMAWRPDAAQLRLLNGYKTRREASVENPNQLAFPFITYMHRQPTPATPSADNITHVSQTTETILGELWTPNVSRRQAQHATR